MIFNCTLPKNIPKSETIVLPVSMNQPFQKGERLRSILQACDRYGYKEQVTILICDYLNRHNCSNEKESLKQGDQFILEHQDMLQGFSLLRWKPFLNALNQDTFFSHMQLIEKNSAAGTKFYNKMKQTWEKCLSSNQKLEASICYQIEEYAATMSMQQFKHLFYPMRISSGLAYIYTLPGGTVPQYHFIKVVEVKKNSTQPLFNKNSLGSIRRNHLNIAFRALLEHMDILLSSAEISIKAKKIFMEETENLMMLHGFCSESKQQYNNELCIDGIKS